MIISQIPGIQPGHGIFPCDESSPDLRSESYRSHCSLDGTSLQDLEFRVDTVGPTYGFSSRADRPFDFPAVLASSRSSLIPDAQIPEGIQMYADQTSCEQYRHNHQP